MTKLSQRIAALTGPNRAIDAEIADALGWWPEGFDRSYHGTTWWRFRHRGEGVCEDRITAPKFLSSIDAALTIVQPALQAHVMHEAMKLLGPRGEIVGKYPQQLACAICEVAMKERGL